MLNEEMNGQVSCKSRGKSAPIPIVNALTKAIKRSNEHSLFNRITISWKK